MNNASSQKGFTSLVALFVTSFLLSIGGPGALVAYGRHSAEDIRKELHQVLGMTIRDLPGLPSAPAIYATMDSDAQIQSPPPPTPTPTPTPTQTAQNHPEDVRVTSTTNIDVDEDDDAKHGEAAAQTKIKFFIKVKE